MDLAAPPLFAGRLARRLPYCLLGLLLLLSALGLHGFSLPYWHKLLDHSPADEVLLGEARKIRINDWAIHVPWALSQGAHDPRFPVHSELIAYGGVDARVGFPAPVADWVTLFRPALWGYFAGSDFGLAWNWWFRVLALLYAGFLAFFVLTRGRTGLAAAAAVALAGSPFLQFWSFSYEPHVAAALFCFVSIAGVARAASIRAMVGWGLLLAWSAGCFALGLLYPPHQVTLAYVIALAAALHLWRDRTSLKEAGRLATRCAVLGVALLLAAAAVAAWYVRSAEAIGRIAGTVFPGGRFDAGGGLDPLRLVNNFFTLFFGEDSLRSFENISEASAFLYLSPLILAVAAAEWIAARRRPDPLVVALAGFQAVLVVYSLVGFPELLARIAFLGRVPAQRTLLALGVTDLIVLVTHLSRRINPDRPVPRWVPLSAALAWGAGLFAVGLAVAARVETAGVLGVAAVTALFFALAWLVALRHRLAAPALALVCVACTGWFNPLVRGGTDYLERNPFCAKVLELDRAGGGGTRWIVFNDPRISNLFRAIGVRAVGGVHYYPQHELWKRLGLFERAEAQWNRYANVQFALKEERDLVGLQLPFLDQLVVRIHPDHPAFSRLEVDYLVLAGKDRRALDGADSLRWVASMGDHHIFRVLRQPEDSVDPVQEQ